MSQPCLAAIDVRTQSGRGPFSLNIAAGECISLRGPSGSGKSLLLRAIADLDPHTGRVLLDGVPCQQFDAPQWRRRIGLLAVESQWWHDTVGAHFPGCDGNTGATNCPWLAPLGFGPEVLGWQVSRLSSGEKQRLALARTFMNQPRVLLLDEPTASLDVINIAAVETLVADYRRETDAAVLWVSHDSAQAARVAGRHYQLTSHGLQEGGS